MTTYTSKPVDVAMSAKDVYDRVSNLAAFGERIDQLPDEVKAKIGSVKFDTDTITINAAPMGDMVLRVSKRVANKHVALTAENAPVPIVLSINLDAKGDNATEVTAAIDVDMPAMLRPIVGPKLREAAEKFGDMIQNIALMR